MKFLKKYYLLIILIIVVLIWFYPLLINESKTNLAKVGLIGQNVNAMANNSLAYPKLAIEAPFTTIHKNPMVTSSWDEFKKALAEGIALSFLEDNFEQSKFIYAIGHSTDKYPHKYSSVFASLNDANVGDEFYIKNNGCTYKYSVIDKKIINPKDMEGFSNLVNRDQLKQQVALVTCWPLYTTKNRLVVIGERQLN